MRLNAAEGRADSEIESEAEEREDREQHAQLAERQSVLSGLEGPFAARVQQQQQSEVLVWKAPTSWILIVAHIYVTLALIHAACELIWAEEPSKEQLVRQKPHWHPSAQTLLAGLGSASCGICVLAGDAWMGQLLWRA